MQRSPAIVARRLAAAAGLVLALAAACAPQPVPSTPSQQRSVAAVEYFPSRALGPLFHDVQLAGILPDSKTFADAQPRSAPTDIVALYEQSRNSPGFDLASFVARHFDLPPATGSSYRGDTASTMAAHIRALWPVLTRQPDAPAVRSSLIPLPRPYVVPGGRFREVYYWDSYFTMLGLVASGRLDLVRDMLDNFAFLIQRFGHIPNGNRSYYLSRSQPPFFAAMVGLYAGATDTARALAYLPALEAERSFWMDGGDRLAPGSAFRRVVRLRDGSVLNRYWDDLPEPRPEAYREDWTLAQSLPAGRRQAFYREVRATAESGWDFSSRWLRDPSDLRTLETTALIPVDLNSLLYYQERLIATLRAHRGGPGDADVARRYLAAAAQRRQALLAATFDERDGFFYDYRWRSGERVRDRPTMAAAAPLYFGVASPEQGRAVAASLERQLLAPGGFRTTTFTSGEQWDAPNGWAPLQWLGVEGLRRYGRAAPADSARCRWLALNRKVWRSTGRLMEKYDVVDTDRPAGGGEYPTQDGFGWTNGVALAFGTGPQDLCEAWGTAARTVPAPARQTRAALTPAPGTKAALVPTPRTKAMVGR